MHQAFSTQYFGRKYNAQFKHKRNNFRKQHLALRKLDADVMKWLLTPVVQTDADHGEFTTTREVSSYALNQNQVRSVNLVCNPRSPITMIFGPPGTGMHILISELPLDNASN